MGGPFQFFADKKCQKSHGIIYQPVSSSLVRHDFEPSVVGIDVFSLGIPEILDPCLHMSKMSFPSFLGIAGERFKQLNRAAKSDYWSVFLPMLRNEVKKISSCDEGSPYRAEGNDVVRVKPFPPFRLSSLSSIGLDEAAIHRQLVSLYQSCFQAACHDLFKQLLEQP